MRAPAPFGTVDDSPELGLSLADRHQGRLPAACPARDTAAGETLDEGNLCVLRPNDGIDAREYDRVLGRRARRGLRRHEPLAWQDIE